MTRKLLLLASLAFLCSCAARKAANTPSPEETVISMQVIDRNGLTETISSKDRLELLQKVDYMAPQPYQKILRVFGKNSKGKNSSKITSYHNNGGLWQYLEIVDGRANGKYKEWYPSGILRIESTVIEGVADINEIAKSSWVFDGISKVYTESGALQAEIHYDKGLLSGPSIYYYGDGTVQKKAYYQKNLLEGEFEAFDENGKMLEKISYHSGLKDGIAQGYYSEDKLSYKEEYSKGKLLTASYFDEDGRIIASVREGVGEQLIFNHGALYAKASINEGQVEGRVELFNKEGMLERYYHVKENKKFGEELVYYPQKTKASTLKPKISFVWQDDVLHGVVKTWYESGNLESQKEICNNKKNGLSFAWYESGEIMMVEEYENDKLLKGSYYKKGEKFPVSKIEDGAGIATMFDKNGIFLKKINYEKGKPLLD